MRAGSFLQPTRIAGFLLLTLLVLSVAAAVSPRAVRAAPDVPQTDGCTPTDGGEYCPLTVTVKGGGTVRADDGDGGVLINCRESGGDCSDTYFYNGKSAFTESLTATPDDGWHFSNWGASPCTVSGNVCRVEMAGPRTVTAIFEPDTYRLTVTVAGAGKGTVTGNNGISCTATCTYDLAPNTSVQLAASPDSQSGSSFGGWSDSCTGTGTCSFNMTGNRGVTATFNGAVKRTLTVSVTGNGRVTGGGFDCTTTCSRQYDNGTIVQLTATPGSGLTTTWGGDCSGTTNTCSLTMSSDRTASATFAAPRRTLNVSVTGTGRVTGSGIDCPGDCTEPYDNGTNVQLTAAPGTGLTTNWGGDCSGTTNTCSLTMSSNKTVSATFSSTPVVQRPLTVTVNGDGTVTGTGINCPGDCSQNYTTGTQVTLTASPATGFALDEWGGDCSGKAAVCTLAMTAARSAVATFARTIDPAGRVPKIDNGQKADPLPNKLPPAVEQVIVQVDGSGWVTSSLGSRVLAGATATKPINCGVAPSGALKYDCYGEYTPGQTLTLKADPAEGYVFKRWTGACAGSSGPTCQVTTRDSRKTSAIFEQGGTGAAVAALLKPPNLRVRWQSSVGAGNLVLRGSTSMAANARIDMRRPGGGPLATRKLKLSGGSFREAMALKNGRLRGGAKLFPGGFTVALTGRAGRLKLPLQMQTISIPAPAEGVVRSAFKSKTQNGTSVTRFPAKAKIAWANFRFETQPRLSQKLSVHWYWPDGRHLGEVQKSNRPVISSYLKLDSGLDSGLWVAELRAGKRVIQRLSVRVG